MKLMIALGLTCYLVGFVSAYGFDAFLQWKDDRKWR